MEDKVFESFPIKTVRHKHSIMDLLFRHATQEGLSEEDQVEIPLHEGAHMLADHDPKGGKISIFRESDTYAYLYESNGDRKLNDALDILLAPYLQKVTPYERMSKADMHSVIEVLYKKGLDHEGILNFFKKLKESLEEN